jgi:hypothetical protein
MGVAERFDKPVDGHGRRRLKIIAIGGEQSVKQVGGYEHDFDEGIAISGGNLRGENVFDGVCEFAEFLVPAGCRVSLEGVDTAPQIAHDPGVTRGSLQQQSLLVEGLENLLGALKEDAPQFVGAIVGKNAHCYASILLYAVPLLR